MPELPEVHALAEFLDAHLAEQVLDLVDVAAISALKTVRPAPSDLGGSVVQGVRRHGKWLSIEVASDDDARALVLHLGRAGWIRWSDALPSGPAPRGPRSRVAMRVRTESGAGFDLTEAGTRKKVAVHVVGAAGEVPAIASLGVDPLGELTVEALRGLLAGRRQQIKGVLRDQGVIAGIGNAYSDEVLHAARLSPYQLAASLTEDQVVRLHEAIRSVLGAAVAAAAGRPAAELKDAKRQGMRVHGRTGQPCPVCGDTVREVSFADSALQYCPTCQTGGQVLADRRTSRFLR